MEQINTTESEKKFSFTCPGCGKSREMRDYGQKFCDEKCEKDFRFKSFYTAEILKIPAIYRDKESDLYAACYLDKSIFCYGPAGTGKTLFAATLAQRYIDREKSIEFYSFPLLMMTFQSLYRNEKADPVEKILEISRSPKILILDDIGIEKLTDYVRQVTYILINERYQQNLTTIITSNKSLGEIDSIIHPGISSRIAGMCEILEFTGNDKRLKK